MEKKSSTTTDSESSKWGTSPLSGISVAVLSDPLESLIVARLVEFSALLRRFGVVVPPTSPKALEMLSACPESRKREIQREWEVRLSWLRPTTLISSADRHNLDTQRERELTEIALKHHRLRARSEFWDTFKQGEVIEVYGLNMIQLYRSLSFFQFCGYSLLDISVHEWYVLWDRPKRAIELLIRCAEKALSTEVPVEAFDLPPHVIRESYQTGLTEEFHPRAYMVEFKHYGSLIGPDDRPAGFICTSLREFLAEGEDALEINFV